MSKPDIKICKRGHERPATDRECKECKKIYNKKYSKENKDLILFKASIRREENRERLRREARELWHSPKQKEKRRIKKENQIPKKRKPKQTLEVKNKISKERKRKRRVDSPLLVKAEKAAYQRLHREEINKYKREKRHAEQFLSMLAGISELTKTLKQHENNDTNDET